jgi:O-antigen/teichoic acid export membrane protein
VTTPSRYVRNLITTASGQAAVLGLGVFTGIASARLLGPESRGELAAITLWPLILVLVASFGINQAIVFHAGKRRFTLSEVWTGALALWLVQSLAVLAAGWMLLPLVLRHYGPETLRLSLLFLAFTPMVLLGGYPASLAQGRLDLLSFSVLRLIAPAVYALGLVALALRGRVTLREVVGLQVLGLALAAAAALGLALGRIRVGLAWSRAACAHLLRFGWRSNLSSLTSYVNQRSDQLLLSLFVGPRDLGLYVVAVALATAAGFFPQAVGTVTIATGANLDADAARKVIARSFRVTLAALAIGCSALFVACPWLIGLAYGPSYSSAATACRILLPGSVALGLNQVLYDGARALERPVLPSYSEGVSTVVTVVGLLLLLPRFGFLGAAVASTLAYSVSLMVMLGLSRSRLNLGLRNLLGVRVSPRLRPSEGGNLNPLPAAGASSALDRTHTSTV